MWHAVHRKPLRYCLSMVVLSPLLVAQAQTVDKPSADGSMEIVAELIVLRVDELAEQAVADTLVAALRAMKGTFLVTADVENKLLRIIAETDGPVTVERLIQYLGLAGYPATEATEEQYRQQEEKLSGRVLEVPSADGLASVKEEDKADGAPAPGDPVAVVSLAESLEPLRLRFNGAKDKYRFVALLSPT